MINILIITAFDLEYLAVKNHLRDVKKITAGGLVIIKGVFGSSSVSVSLLQIGEGNTNAASKTTKAILLLKPTPTHAFFVGVAGRLKDRAQIGDIVVASKIYDYSSGKAGDSFEARPSLFVPSDSLLQEARYVATEAAWLKHVRLPQEQTNAKFKAFIKPIASGGMVLSSTKSEVYHHIRAHHGDAIAVEMEGYGFLAAFELFPTLYRLVVRGVSDFVDDKSNSDLDGGQEIAAATAAAFTFSVIDELIANQIQQENNADAETAKINVSESDYKKQAMELIKGRILSRFAEQHSMPNHVIDERWIRFELMHKLNPKQCNFINDSIDYMVKEGLLVVEERTGMVCLVLTEKGYDKLY